jgi:hypothetical protein
MSDVAMEGQLSSVPWLRVDSTVRQGNSTSKGFDSP